MPLLTQTMMIEADARLFVKALLRRDPLNAGRADVLMSEAVGQAMNVLATGKGHEAALVALDQALTRATAQRTSGER